MRIGYACMNLTLGTRTRTCRLANCTPERAADLARENLASVAAMARWNAAHGMGLLRVTSNLVPFGSHPASGDWRGALAEDFARTGEVLAESGQRVSAHPGQFVVLGTEKPLALEGALRELDYQADVMDLLGVEGTLVIHLGGAYGDPEGAIDRFVERARALPRKVRGRLVVENDDKVFNAADALRAGERAKLPVVFDVLHDALLPSPGLPWKRALAAALGTWGDRKPKIHYSDQEPSGQRGQHARRVDPARFGAFLDATRGLPDFDVMIEAKDKEQAVMPLLPLVEARNAKGCGKGARAPALR